MSHRRTLLERNASGWRSKANPDLLRFSSLACHSSDGPVFRGFPLNWLDLAQRMESDPERALFPSRFSLKEMESLSSSSFTSFSVFLKIKEILSSSSSVPPPPPFVWCVCVCVCGLFERNRNSLFFFHVHFGVFEGIRNSFFFCPFFFSVSTAFEWYLSVAGCKSSLHSGICLAHRKEGVTLWCSYVWSSSFPFLYALWLSPFLCKWNKTIIMYNERSRIRTPHSYLFKMPRVLYAMETCSFRPLSLPLSLSLPPSLCLSV